MFFGGIVVEPSMTRASIDTTAMTGLAPGLYTFRILPGAGSDTAGARTITFTIPMLAKPEFLTKPAYSGIVGSQLPVSVVSRSSGKIDSNSVAFLLVPVPGIAFFRDSLLTSPILPTDTLMTGKNGKARRFWVRGDAAGTYTLRTSLTGTDTVDTYPGITFTLRGLRYVDSLGSPIVPGTGFQRDVRTSVRIWLQALAGGAHDRRSPHRRKAGATDMVAAQPHLVCPVDLGTFALGLASQRGIGRAAPLRDGLVVALVGTAHGLLRRHAPGLQVAPHRRRRQFDAVLALDQCGHGLACPQVERQPQLVGHLADDQPIDAPLLRGVQPASACRAAAIIGLQAAKSTVPGPRAGLVHKPQAHAEDLRRLDLRHSLAHREHHLTANMRLSRSV